MRCHFSLVVIYTVFGQILCGKDIVVNISFFTHLYDWHIYYWQILCTIEVQDLRSISSFGLGLIFKWWFWHLFVRDVRPEIKSGAWVIWRTLGVWRCQASFRGILSIVICLLRCLLCKISLKVYACNFLGECIFWTRKKI